MLTFYKCIYPENRGGPNPRGETKSASIFGLPWATKSANVFGPGGPDPLADLDRGDEIRGAPALLLVLSNTFALACENQGEGSKQKFSIKPTGEPASKLSKNLPGGFSMEANECLFKVYE